MTKRREIDWDSQPYGVETDTEIARRLGVSRSRVMNRRGDRGLPAAPHPHAPKGIDWDKQPLGELPDRELAERLGVTPAAVYHQRTRRGIPSPTARPTPAPRSEPDMMQSHHRLSLEVAELLLEARTAARLSVADLAQESGISADAIASWEQATGTIPLVSVARVLDACGYDLVVDMTEQVDEVEVLDEEVEEKACVRCATVFQRRRDPDGHLERADRWQARRYCSRACSNAVTADLKRLRNAARRRSRDRADVS